MIKARIEYNGDEYEGVLSKLFLYHSTNETVYGGMICVDDKLQIEFDDIPEEDIEIYNDAIDEYKEPEKTIKHYWRYRTTEDGGVYSCPVCSYETEQMSPYCPRCGTEFNIEWGVAMAEL